METTIIASIMYIVAIFIYLASSIMELKGAISPDIHFQHSMRAGMLITLATLYEILITVKGL